VTKLPPEPSSPTKADAKPATTPIQLAPQTANTDTVTISRRESVLNSNDRAPTVLARGKIPSREQEYEHFKQEQGYDLYKVMCENKITLKDKKLQAKSLAEKVNDIKSAIDQIKSKMNETQVDALDSSKM
jgi:hypothetical protein